MTTSPIFPTQPLERVREGMTVLDAAGARLGTVRRVQMGDPQAVTTQGNEPVAGTAGAVTAPSGATAGESGVAIGAPFAASDAGELDVPAPLRRQLQRTGFIEVDGPDLSAADRYVPGDRVADVAGDMVHLRPAPDAAPRERPRAGETSTEEVLEPAPAANRVTTSRVHAVTTTAAAPARRTTSARAVVWGGSATVAAAGGAGAGWLYRRWRRERNRPINRVRRALTTLAAVLPAGTMPVGPLGGGLAIAALLAVRRRARTTGEQPAEQAAGAPPDDHSGERRPRRPILDSAPASLALVEPAGTRASDYVRACARMLAPAAGVRHGVGVGTLVALSAAGYLARRWLRGSGPDHSGRSVSGPSPVGERAAAGAPPEQTAATGQGSSAVAPTSPDRVPDKTQPTASVTREQVVLEHHPLDRQPADQPVGADAGETIRIPVEDEESGRRAAGGQVSE